MAQEKRLDAKPNDPWLGVHVLTEFIFCPRAGLIAFEQETEDDGEEEIRERPRLDYIPRWEMHSIERALNEVAEEVKRKLVVFKKWLKRIILATVIALPIMFLVITENFRGDEVWFILALLPLTLLLPGWVLKRMWGSIRNERHKLEELGRIRDTALAARPAEPDERVQDNQLVEWWSLWQAGFESINYKEPLRHDAWRLAGRPWRVLRRGSLRIPVFRKRCSDEFGARRLFRQHYARMAAYCHLLEACEGAQSPYGIVLFDDGTYEGVAISKEARGSWVPLRDGLTQARRVIYDSRNCGKDPDPPDQSNLCKGCNWGKPFVHRKGESQHTRFGKPLKPRTVEGVDGRPYHSACGDRFRWVPPHAKAFGKELLPDEFDDDDDYG